MEYAFLKLGDMPFHNKDKMRNNKAGHMGAGPEEFIVYSLGRVELTKILKIISQNKFVQCG